MYGHLDIIECLLEHGADVSSNTLRRAIENGRLDIIECLIKYGADIQSIGVDQLLLKR
jgi:ankyrin repeat protein